MVDYGTTRSYVNMKILILTVCYGGDDGEEFSGVHFLESGFYT